MKKLFTLIAVAAMAFAAQATEWTAADGTATGEFAPVYGYNFETNQHNQMQYPAAELTGLAAGTEITGVKFYTSTPDLVNALGGTVTVSLANMVDVTPWELNTWGEITGDLLDVEVTAVATVVPEADEDGVWTITFDAPFSYYGGALLIDVQTVTDENFKETKFYGKEMDAVYVMTVYGYFGTKKGQTILPKATFTYEGGEEPGLANLAEANALDDDAEFKFDGDAVVTVFRNGYLFLRDESGYGMIAGVTGEFENGQVLSEGWTATKTSVNDGWVRYTDAAGLSASGETNAELAAAQKLTAFPNESMVNAYVYIENAVPGSGGTPFLPQRAFTLPDDNKKISVTDCLWPSDWDASGGYNVYGVICKVDNTLKFDVLEFVQYVEPQGLRGDVNKDENVSIGDVTALIDHLLSNDFVESDEFSPENADANLDELISIGDVTAIIDYLLSHEWPAE